MNLGARPKAVLIVLVMVAVLGYLVIVDLGINAGRIHRGVEVGGLNVGGLTPTEAEDALRARADELKYSLLNFTRGDLACRVTPLEVGWNPRPAETAMAAREVGRGHNLWTALNERVRAWIFGTKVHWRGGTDEQKMNHAVSSCERLALAQHLTLDRHKFRKKIKRAIVQWPRKKLRIPVTPG